jgi:hypothetical protein
MKKRRTRPVLVPDELIPAANRLLLSHGPIAVMQADWRDPTDTTPTAARQARTIRGFRAYDPLRRIRARHGDRSQITEEHVVAADRLRRAYDQGRLGGLPGPSWLGGIQHGEHKFQSPRSGPTAQAMAMWRADREFRRAWAMFDDLGRAMLYTIVLKNLSVTYWTRSRRLHEQTTPQREMARLVGSLNRLVEHFDTEVREDIQAGVAA